MLFKNFPNAVEQALHFSIVNSIFLAATFQAQSFLPYLWLSSPLPPPYLSLTSKL
jgi:hypothetical protein